MRGKADRGDVLGVKIMRSIRLYGVLVCTDVRQIEGFYGLSLRSLRGCQESLGLGY